MLRDNWPPSYRHKTRPNAGAAPDLDPQLAASQVRYHFACGSKPVKLRPLDAFAMPHRPTVFVDSNVIKFATETTVLVPRQQRLNWAGREIELTVHDFGTRREVDLLPEGELRQEALLLRRVAEEARDRRCRLVTQAEVVHETWTLPWVRGAQLYDVEIEWVDAPLEYSRILGRVVPSAPNERRNDMKESTIEFLSSVDYPRFKQLQIACGAAQGNRVNENQLIDAFHVWSAESAGAEYFLTLDFKLIRCVRTHKRFPPSVKLVKPSELLYEVWKSSRAATGG
jgi:hypothetical protein